MVRPSDIAFATAPFGSSRVAPPAWDSTWRPTFCSPEFLARTSLVRLR